jgi:hypothetical protein
MSRYNLSSTSLFISTDGHDKRPLRLVDIALGCSVNPTDSRENKNFLIVATLRTLATVASNFEGRYPGMGLLDFATDVRELTVDSALWSPAVQLLLDIIGNLWCNSGRGLRLLLDTTTTGVFVESLYGTLTRRLGKYQTTHSPADTQIVTSCVRLLISAELIHAQLQHDPTYTALSTYKEIHTNQVYDLLRISDQSSA